MVLAGRGFGKTRAGAEWIHEEVQAGRAGRIALVADDAKDARDVMIEGESGLLATARPGWRPRYIPSQAKVEWDRTGATAILYSARDPESLRGPQHDKAWCDELGKWRYQRYAWDMLQMGMRLGRPRTLVTTTPTPSDVVLELDDRSRDGSGWVVITGGPTHENLENLAPEFQRVIAGYEGTRLGRQELYAEILRDIEGALWTQETIQRGRVRGVPELLRVVVAIDPAVTSGPASNETGLVVCGLDAATREHGYLLADGSGRYSPGDWATRALDLYDQYAANYIVAEGNQGGDMVQATLLSAAREQRRARPKVVVVHATQGKWTRAEPVAALAERGMIHHVGLFPKLEDQLTRWVPGGGQESPDRLDAYVWGFTELLVKPAYTSKLMTH